MSEVPTQVMNQQVFKGKKKAAEQVVEKEADALKVRSLFADSPNIPLLIRSIFLANLVSHSN